MTTRKGKIARLPHATRERLNQRLLNGEEGAKLVPWLNAQPAVRAVLAAEFAGRPITEQNLSEWKQGGYEDWLRHQEARDWVRSLTEESAELKREAGDYSVADHLAAPLAVALGRWLHQVAASSPNDAEQRKALFGLSREVSRLRRDDDHTQSRRFKRECWVADQAAQQENNRALAPLAPLLHSLFISQVAALFESDLERLNGKIPLPVQVFINQMKKFQKTADGAGPSSPPGEPPTTPAKSN